MTPLQPVTVHSVVESFFSLDGGAMFGIIPKPLWQRTNPADDANRIRLATRCLYLETPERRILIDAGMGLKWSAKEQKIYDIQAQGAIAALQQAHVAAESITDVVITHLHFDHVGGLTWTDAQGQLRPTFPKARHWVQRENWVWAHHPTLRDAGSYRPENFSLFGSLNGPPLHLIDGTSILFDTLEVIATFGHTPGLQMVRFQAAGHPVIYASDILPTLGHLPLPYVMGYDLQPVVTVREKHDLLEYLLQHDGILALEHDPHHGFARLRREGSDRYSVEAAAASLEELF